MGDTWGISGPTFLLSYVVLAVVVLIASIRARRAVTRAGGAEPVTAIRTRPHDVAYLNGGAELAVVSALTALRLRGRDLVGARQRAGRPALGRRARRAGARRPRRRRDADAPQVDREQPLGRRRARARPSGG